MLSARVSSTATSAQLATPSNGVHFKVPVLARSCGLRAMSAQRLAVASAALHMSTATGQWLPARELRDTSIILCTLAASVH